MTVTLKTMITDWLRIKTQVGTPATPASGYSVIYEEGGALKLKTDAGTITTFSASQISDTAYDATSWNGVTTIAPSKNAVRDKFESLAVGFTPSHFLIPNLFYDSNVNWSSISASVSNNYLLLSTGAQNAELVWNINLPAGTYTWCLGHSAGTNRGIYSLFFDGSSITTIDGYNAVDNIQTLSSVTSLTCAGGSPVAVKIKMATKNGSASQYYGCFWDCWLIRTGA